MDKSWPRAVKKAMFEATLAEIDPEGERSPAFNYRWEHVTTVVKLALKLAEVEGADPEIVEAAAWLHDIAKVEGEEHAKLGAEFARSFLGQTDFPSEKIKLVSEAIAEHKGLWRETPLSSPESKILWDADKLSKIGLTAVAHWIGMVISEEKQVSVADLISMGRGAQWQAKTAASMHTEAAREAAVFRWKAFDQFWDRLEIELEGDDLSPMGEI
jgi:uncharacterized protein